MAEMKWNPQNGDMPRSRRELTRGALLAYFQMKENESKRAEFAKMVSNSTENGVLKIGKLRDAVIPKFFPHLVKKTEDFLTIVGKWNQPEETKKTTK